MKKHLQNKKITKGLVGTLKNKETEFGKKEYPKTLLHVNS